MKITKRQLKKIISETLNENKIPGLKKGDFVWRVMERYNPQLGTYYVFEEKQVEAIRGNTISLVNDFVKFYVSDGTRKGKSKDVYGSSSYEIMSEKDARTYYNELIAAGKKARGFK